MNLRGARSTNDEWGTPAWLFRELDREFRFDLDVCARPALAKCRRYFTPEVDGLSQSWAGRRCWMNPPYSRGAVARWVEHALRAASALAATRRAFVVALLPVSSDTAWFHDLAARAELRFIQGRLRFDGAGGGTSSPFPTVVAVLSTARHRWRTIGPAIDARGRHRLEVAP